jgi:hypothetical protein
MYLLLSLKGLMNLVENSLSEKLIVAKLAKNYSPFMEPKFHRNSHKTILPL